MAKATVYIWMPSGAFMKNVVGIGLGVGHAALELKREAGQIYYITWMAHGSPFNALVPSKAGPVYKYIGQFTKDDDKANMLGFFGHEEPSYSIELPALRLPTASRGLRFGVDVPRIESFWEDRLQTSPQYAFLSTKQNCTGCVVDALRAGGLDRYLDDPNKWVVQGAGSLLAWVQGAKAKLDGLNQRQASVERFMADRLARHRGDGPLPIPSFQEWQRESDQNVRFGLVASRKDQIAAIDEMVKDYPNAKDPVSRCVLLVKMQHEIYSHLINKPTSDRRAAVEALGTRVTSALLDNRLNGDELAKLGEAMHDWVIRTMAWRA